MPLNKKIQEIGSFKSFKPSLPNLFLSFEYAKLRFDYGVLRFKIRMKFDLNAGVLVGAKG